MAEVLELHDRRRFELTGISFGPRTDDAMRLRVSAALDRFIDVRERSDLDVARLCRELGVDIAVDLKGYTQDCRPGILAELRPKGPARRRRRQGGQLLGRQHLARRRGGADQPSAPQYAATAQHQGQ